MKGALKEEARGVEVRVEEVLGFLEIGWLLMMILRMGSEVAAVVAEVQEIGGPTPQEVVAAIG